MGKRGPQPRGEYADKSAVLSTRISAELRAQLEKAVKASGLTLSREVEHRLRRTFQEEASNAQMFGSQRNFRLMQLVGVAMTLRDPDRGEVDWLSDPSLFVQVLRTIHHLLWQIRPPGTEQQFSIATSDYSAEVAEAIWAMIHSSDTTLPFGVSERQHRANKIKADLGEIVDRPTYSLTNYIPPPPEPVGKPDAAGRKGKTRK
jgi:hypothetical protein